MDDINQSIQIAFQATQLILVFVTILFGLYYPQIQKAILQSIPKGNRIKERMELRNKLVQIIKEKCVPLLLINGIASYLFLPLFIQVVSESNLKLWNFDFARTSYVFIALLIFVFFIWTIYLSINLYNQIREIDKLDNIIENKPL